MDRCDVSGCRVIGYSVSVDAGDFQYHFCQAHFDKWGAFLDKVEQNGIIDVKSKKWISTIEKFLKEIKGE